MINTNKIVSKLIKYTIAIVVCLFLLGISGVGVSAKSDVDVAMGIGLYLVLVAGWIIVIGSEINSFVNKSVNTTTTNDTQKHE